MDQWDEAKLEEVVNTKHGEANKSMPATTIVSYIAYKLEYKSMPATMIVS
jgi:hypothetical protein